MSEYESNNIERGNSPHSISSAITVKFSLPDRSRKYSSGNSENPFEDSSDWYSPISQNANNTIRNYSDITPENTTDDDFSEVIMSAFWKSGKLGAAYYCVNTSEVHVLPDIVDVNPEFNLLKCIYNQVKPSQVITSGRASNKFVLCLKSLLNVPSPQPQNQDEMEVESLTEAKLVCLPGKDFYFEPCRRRVLSIKLPGEPKEMSEEEHNNYIHSLIDMTAEVMVQALGALLLYLDRTWAEMNLQPGLRSPPILLITTVSLHDIVMIDSASYEALQIFNQKSHPSNFKKWAPGSSKEGLSVYGIFNRCKSQLGCCKMREMFLHPSRNIQILTERLDVIDFCIKGRNSDIVKNLLDCLKNISSVTRIMTKLAVTQATVKDWKSLYKTVYNCILIGEICTDHTKDAAIFQKIKEYATEELHQMGQYIYRVMDFEESEAQNKFVVRMGIDEELDKLKHKHLGLSDLMSRVAEEELENLPPEVKECSLMYVPEIGYILCLPMWKDDMEEDDFYIPGLEFKFKANNIAHYKSARCREMDIEIGDCSVQVMTHELRIMVKLIDYILEHITPVIKIVNLAAQLDSLIALAMIARENGYVRPELIKDERIIEINGGRHPLQELCIDSFVPNHTYLGQKEGWGQMKILTGPNASGKSVYLKQVALITYLAHIGSYVPAESARIGVIDSLFTRIRTSESVSMQLSAFMIDLCQVSSAVNCSSPSSLIIIDEFGKGTAELDGLALLTATLKHFLSRGQYCPHVLVSTHFHNIAQILQPSPGLSFQTLDHMMEEDRIIYLYKIKDGGTNSSFAHRVAEGVGIDTKIIKRSIEALTALEEVKPLKGITVEEIRNKYHLNVKVLQKVKTEILDENAFEEFLLKLRELLKGRLM